jgi:hypothetical protein
MSTLSPTRIGMNLYQRRCPLLSLWLKSSDNQKSKFNSASLRSPRPRSRQDVTDELVRDAAVHKSGGEWLKDLADGLWVFRRYHFPTGSVRRHAQQMVNDEQRQPDAPLAHHEDQPWAELLNPAPPGAR